MTRTDPLTNNLNKLTYSNIQKGEEEEEKRAKLFRFPQGTIKKLVKLDEDVHMASQVQTNHKGSDREKWNGVNA